MKTFFTSAALIAVLGLFCNSSASAQSANTKDKKITSTQTVSKETEQDKVQSQTSTQETKTTQSSTTQPTQLKPGCSHINQTGKDRNCLKTCPHSNTKCNKPCMQKVNTTKSEEKKVVPKE